MKDKSLAYWIIKFRYLGILLPLSLCISSLFFIRHIKVATQHQDFIPIKHPFIEVQRRLNRYFGGLNRVNIAIVVKKGSILKPEVLRAVRGMAEDIQLLDEVNPRRVYSIFAHQVKYIKIHKDGFSVQRLIDKIPATPQEISSLKQKIIHNPLVYGPLISKDFKATLIQADFYENISSPKIYKEIKGIVKRYKTSDFNVYLNGEPILEGYIDGQLSFILYVFAAALLVILSLLFMAFKKKRAFLLPLLAGGISVMLSLAGVELFHYTLNPFTVLIPFLIFILAVSHSIQFVERYFEEAQMQTDKTQVALNTLTSLLSPIRASLFTDFLGFASLILIPIPAIHSIAVLGSIGVLSIWASVVIFLPSVFAIIPLPVLSKNNSGFNLPFKVLGFFSYLWQSPKRIYFVLTVFVSLFIIAIYGMLHITVGEIEPGTSVLYHDAPYNVAARKINNYFSGSNPYYVLVSTDHPEGLVNAKVMTEMDALEKYLCHHLKEAGYSLSIADYIKLMNLAVQHRFMIPQNDRTIGEYLFLYESNAFPGELNGLMTPDHRYANIRVDLKDCRSSTIKRAIYFTKEWLKKFHHFKGLKFAYAGGPIGILGATNDIIKSGLFSNMMVLCVLIFIRICLALKSLSGGAFLFIPLAFSIALTFGSFGIFNVPFTIATLPVAAMGTGLGIDYSIYLASRIKEEREKGIGLFEAVNKAVFTCGKAVLFTGSILTIGVWSWMFSNLKLQAKLGGTLGGLLLFNMLAALIVLPIFILLLNLKFLRERV